MSDDVDPEILYAAALGVTLGRMRAELDEAAVKRILTFVLDRYAVDVIDLRVRASPPVRIIAKPAAHDVFPNGAPAPVATIEPIHRATCPICDWGTLTEKGLNLHMFHKHGTTLKEYTRTKALDTKEAVAS